MLVLAVGAGSLAAGGALFAWSGLYSVSAAREHWGPVEWLLAFVMRNSVETHAIGTRIPPDLGSRDRYLLGAAHFDAACAGCHGAPGATASPVAQAMLPAPPELAPLIANWTAEELFWIVKNGIKYTGMPAWPAPHFEDEVWSVVAFLQHLPTLNEGEYRALALGDDVARQAAGKNGVNDEGLSGGAVGACVRCHGDEATGPPSALVPILHGQNAGYLAASLSAYRDGTRASGFMQPAAAHLEDTAIAAFAGYYAALVPPPPRVEPTALAARGGEFATNGIAETEVPPCVTCHGPTAASEYPRLEGQSAAYMTGRLQRWKTGLDVGTDLAHIMAPIAARLSDDEIAALAVYFRNLLPTASTAQ